MQAVSNLDDAAYEPVNQDYGWVKYGEVKVLIRKKDGYVNATKLCKKGGKEFFHWNSNEASKQMVNELLLITKLCKNKLIEKVLGGNNLIRGTYVHPFLVPHIATWISPRFGIIVSKIIQEWRELSSRNEASYWTVMGDCISNYPSENNQEEKKWQELVAAREKGEMEVETRRGSIDVLTPTKIIEVKHASRWKHAIGQVICYRQEYMDRVAAIYLFDSESAPRDIIEEDCRAFGIEVQFLE